MKKAIIMGAGPAGLTAAYELIRNNIKPVIIEKDSVVGGIARTVKYKEYRFDIGGHRFFTKNEEVEKLWEDILGEDFLTRNRLSRWYYNKKFFNYPINPLEILKIFGLQESAKIIASYAKAKIFPKKEKNIEDWYINQFGEYLAKPFFIDFNKKLWGVPCNKLNMDFGKQRVKGVSFYSIIKEHVKKILRINREDVKSLISKFRYPKYGPGMMWEEMKRKIEKKGGKFLMESEVVSINHENNKIVSVTVKNKNKKKNIPGKYFLSSIPLKELIMKMNPKPEAEIVKAAESLKFRAFVAVALVLNKEKIFPDTWIYTHDKGMACIRIQNFNNWSPFLVPKGKTCLGFEYTCNFNDEFWNLDDEGIRKIAIEDLEKAGFAEKKEVVDSKIIRLKDVYPVYTLDYKEKVSIIKRYIDKFNKNFKNIQPIGRGGMHKYNNMDHSMMTALLAARNILGKEYDIWKVNTDAEYHEEEKEKNQKKVFNA